MKEKILFLLLIVITTFQVFQLSIQIRIFISLFEIVIILYLVFKIQKMRDSKKEQLEEDNQNGNQKIIQLLRLYRHDWQNHLQIILGYASLNKAEYITKYVKKVNVELKQGSTISAFTNQELAVFLYMTPIRYPKLKIELEIEEGFEQYEKNADGNFILDILRELIETFYKIKEDISSQQLYISLIGTEDKIIINFEYVGNSQQVYSEILHIGKKINAKNSQFLVDIHNDEETILDIQLPLHMKQERATNVC